MKTATKPLSKVNAKISDLAQRIIEIQDYNANDDFNTREDSICANIKVYEWIDDDDVNKIIKDHNLQHVEDDILAEFNEERQQNIYNHHCEYEVEYLKEKYETNCDVSNPYKSFQLYQRFLESDFKAWPIEKYTVQDKHGKIIRQGYHLNSWRHDEFIEFSERKNNTLEDYKKDYIKRHKWEYEEFERRALINFECWQYGRSGGWFSVCRTSELEGQEFESYDFYTNIQELENEYDNDEFNRILRDEMQVFYTDKKQFISEMETFIKDWETKKEAIEYYINEIEDGLKYFKESLLERIQDEILRFVEDDLNIEASNVKIQIQDEKIKTSLGVSVDLSEFKEAFNSVKGILLKMKEGDKHPIKKHVGGYFVEYAKKVENDILIKAGCHRFSLNNINEILTT